MVEVDTEVCELELCMAYWVWLVLGGVCVCFFFCLITVPRIAIVTNLSQLRGNTVCFIEAKRPSAHQTSNESKCFR